MKLHTQKIFEIALQGRRHPRKVLESLKHYPISEAISTMALILYIFIAWEDSEFNAILKIAYTYYILYHNILNDIIFSRKHGLCV